MLTGFGASLAVKDALRFLILALLSGRSKASESLALVSKAN